MFGRLLVIAVFTAATATAQFTSLVVSGDGSVLYFSSSLNLRTDNGEPNWPKIFRYRQSTGAFELAYEFATPPTTWPGPDAKGAYMLASPDVSSDGNTLVYTATGGYCAGGSGCIAYLGPTPEAYLVQGTAPPLIISNSSARLSRNGRYVYLYPEPADCLTCVVPGRLYDLQAGTISNLPLVLSLPGDGYQVISDDGAVLFGQLLFQQGQQTVLATSHPPVVERMSADAAIVVYESSGLLIRFTVATGQETIVARVPGSALPNEPYFQPWLSDDGSLVSYLNQPADAVSPVQQVFLARTDGSTPPLQLTAEPEGVASAVLSGSGNMVYAVTATSRIIQVQVATGQVTELSGPISVLATGGGAPGSATTLQATQVHSPGTPLTVKVGGIEAPVLGYDANSITIQIPWELAGGNPFGVTLPIDISTTPVASVSQFDESFNVSFVAPVFLAVAHQDFHGPVTSSDPASPQEIVHFFMTGLGPVSPTIATGAVTPVGAFYNVTSPPVCSFDFSGASVPAPLLFAGLAPGMIGVYQVDVMIPPPGNQTYGSYFNCTDYLQTSPFSAWYSVQLAVPVTSP